MLSTVYVRLWNGCFPASDDQADATGEYQERASDKNPTLRVLVRSERHHRIEEQRNSQQPSDLSPG